MAPPLPTAAKVVAIYAIIIGSWELIDFILLASGGYFNFQLTLLLLPCGIGLLNASNGWRLTARVVFGISILLVPLILILMQSGQTGVAVNLPDNSLVYLITLAHFIFDIWAFIVLGRADVLRACNAAIP